MHNPDAAPLAMISKSRSRQILVGLIACAIVGIGLSLPTYFIQRQGVCLTAGRVLSSEELHRAFLVDVVNYELRTSYNINWERGNDTNWAGIAELAGKPDLLEMVKTASGNDKSFEENFGLKVLLKGRNDRIPPATIKAKDLPERFMFVGYQVFSGWGGEGQPFISPMIFKKFLSAISDRIIVPRRSGKFHFLTGFAASGTIFFSWTHQALLSAAATIGIRIA